MTSKVVSMEIPAGIQRDGTTFDAPCFTDGKWVRFQRNRPRKIGGYHGIFLGGNGISRGMAMTSVNGFNYVVSGYNNGLEQWITDDDDGVGSGPYAYTLSNFTPSTANLWQFDISYDYTGNGTNNLVAHPGQNLRYMTSTANTPVLYGTFPGTTGSLTMSKVGVFTASANTTSGSPTVTLTASNVRVGAGQSVTGTGIPANTKVSTILGNTVTLTKNATATTTAPLSGVNLTGTAGQFSCTATTGLATGQLINISGSTTPAALGGLYAINSSGRFNYSGAALSVGTPVTISGTATNTALTSSYAISTAGGFSCTASATPLSVGQQVIVSGTATDTVLGTVYNTNTTANFTCTSATPLAIGQIVTVSGTPTATSLTNVYATGLAGTFSCTSVNTLAVGQTVSVTGSGTATTLSGVYSTGAAGTLVCNNSSTVLQVGQTVTTTGTTSTTALSSVVITGTAGTFQCAASPVTLYVGQPVVISGVFGGTGTITGYANPTTYYIITTNGSTTFTLSASLGGAAVATTAGTPTGVTYTLSAATGYGAATYYIIATNGVNTLTLSATSGGAAVTSTVGATTGLTFAANALTVSGSSPYYIIATNGSSTFTLSATSGGAALTTTIGAGTGFTFNANALSISGYSSGTNYYIIATNGSSTFQLSTTSGGAAVTTTAGPSTGLTFTAKASNIAAATYYIIATNGGTTFTLSTTPTGSGVTTTIGPTTGLSVTAQATVITGYVSPKVYFVIATDGASYFQLSATSGGSAITNTIGPVTGLTFLINAPSALSGVVITGAAGQFSCSASPALLQVGQPVVISGAFGGTGSITGYLNSTTYYIIATNGTTTFTLSATLGGTAITTTAGTPTGLTYTLSGAVITGYPGMSSYYIIATNGTSTFQISDTAGGTGLVTAIGTATNLTFSVSNPKTLTFDNNIAVSGGCVVIHPYLFVYGNNGLIQNSSAGDFSDWVAADANANNVATGKIVKGLPIRGGSTSPSGLFWAADALIRVSFAPSSSGGTNYYWTYDLVSSQTSVLSSSGIIEYDGIFYWAGVDRFLSYNGVVQEIPNNNNQNYFFDNINLVQRQKVWATKVPRYGEIWWFYPKGDATECTDAIIYNVREKAWYDAGQALGARRSAGVFSEVFPKPIWAGNESSAIVFTSENATIDTTTTLILAAEDDRVVPGLGISGLFIPLDTTVVAVVGVTVTMSVAATNSSNIPVTFTGNNYTLWQHETGVDAVRLKNVTAIQSYFETFSVGTLGGLVGTQQQPGDNLWTRIERIEPDFVQTGEMSVVVTGEGYADDTPVTSAPYTFLPTTLKIDMREQRREMRLRFESNVAGGTYQTGRVLLSLTTGDVRGTGNP